METCAENENRRMTMFNPLLWIFGRTSTEAPRQQHDPGPIRQRTARTVSGEPFARHLRMKGRRIAVERTLIPAGWSMAPETQAKVIPEAGQCELRWRRALMRWKEEMAVGKRALEHSRLSDG